MSNSTLAVLIAVLPGQTFDRVMVCGGKYQGLFLTVQIKLCPEQPFGVCSCTKLI